ncbi:MAG TPA: RluA family pseudouridine synthase [Acidimicrobiia bacterium]|nr:RluA family pseudouridine synthase [Acidimicrobiia bacterium]
MPDTLAGERIDRAVALLTGWSRVDVQSLLADGAVLVDGRAPAKSHRLTAGAVIELLAEPDVETLPVAEPVPIDVRYADDDLIVVNKAAGMVVHPGAGHAHGTLVHGLLARFPELAQVGDAARPGLVHRLDRDTSGLLVVARSPRAYERLVAALADHAVERRYLALVRGIPEARRARIDAPIGRSTRRRTQMAIRAEGRDARTTYEVIDHAGDVALLRCRLETGRTHQIRVHLAAIGHPVVGDTVYGGGAPAPPATRPFLHAAALTLDHPVSGETCSFDAELPADLAGALATLGLDAPTGGDRAARTGDEEAGHSSASPARGDRPGSTSDGGA